MNKRTTNSVDQPTGDTTNSRRFILLAGIVAVVLFVAATTAFLVSEIGAVATANGSSGKGLPDYGEIVDFTLTERSGAVMTRDDLVGTVWIADFIFTSCAGPCPLMTRRMAGLQEKMADRDGVRLVSFSVDPERDTPEVLAAYADEYGADRDSWWFLTGTKSAILRVAVDGFHLGSRDDPLLHSTRFILVDAQGHIRGYYESESPDAMTRLLRDADLLRRSGTS